MSKTEFGVNHPLAVKVWSKQLAAEAYRKTYIGKFIGKGEDSLIQEKVDLKKSAGDKITCGLNVQLQGDGVQGDSTLEGNEEALQFYDDSVIVDQLRHATRSKGKMSEQRVPYNIRNTGKDRLADWWARRMETSFFNQICGYTAATDTRFTGNNAVTAPTSNRILRGGNQSDDQSITSGDPFLLQHIDVARERAETSSTENDTGPLIRPIRYMGDDYYVMFLHDHQVTSLRTDAATAGNWVDIQKAAMQGGDVRDNPIFTGALGVYNGVILHKSNYVTQGVHSSTGAAVANTRRAVLCGAQSATIAFGSENGATRYSWKEELFDYGNQLGVSAGSIYGLKKTKFTPADDSATNAEDFGTIVVTTYATAATPT
ncbi:N4-gp56 family major capsid protein [uncultured Ruegeria sp.]|uniref:N4-gp56 family major capsid protein n=1 Tax=uncultured Ruegeria sp. TaxID=259304 RepID=UPI00262CC0A4|nr:N4-gp56 family major capsid protein [uncultured Ruegeria sp.]